MCDEISQGEYILKKGTILYSGNTGKKVPLSLSNIFSYIGGRGEIDISGEFVLYASSDYETAKGYALSCLVGGFVHQFKVVKDVVLWKQDVFSDAEEIANCVCPRVRGIIVIYSEKKDEVGLCSAEDYLEYIQTQNCSTGEWYHVVDKVVAKDIVNDVIPEN
jgi:hypothetical protein